MLVLQIKEFLSRMCEQIKYQPIHKEIAEEMENHLLEAKENFVLEGMQEKEAEEEATKQMGNAEEIGKKLNQIHRPKLDWKLLMNTFVLMCFGGVILWIKAKTTDAINGIFLRYAGAVCLGIFMSIGVYFMDYRKLFKSPKMLYLIATLLIVLTFNFGASLNGKKSWMSLGGISIAIPVLAVPFYILAFIGFIQNVNKGQQGKIRVLKKEIIISIDILKVIILTAISLYALLLVSTITSAVVLGIVYLMITTAKLAEEKENRIKKIVKLWGITFLIGLLIVFLCIDDIPVQRFIVAFSPEKDPAGGGWIGINQKLILNSANLFGEAGDMSNTLEVFDEGTNFAFLSILAHYGWIVAIVMLIAIVTFSVKLIINAVKIKDMYGKLVIVGISSLFILQSIFNLLMNLNLGIKSDFNIPFISYGNTNLVINMVCLALVLSVYRRKDIIKSSDLQSNENKKALF